MKLRNITFIFENCDSITIDGKYVGHFLVDDIKTSIERIACNAIDRMDVCHTFAIEIHKDANKERYAFDQTHIERFKEMTFDRFKEYGDITHIQFELYDAYAEEGEEVRVEHYDYYIHWTGKSEYTNESQKVYISNSGSLYIAIGEKPFEDYFDMEFINDETSVDFHFDMLDVGDEYSNPDRYNNEEDDE